MRPVPVKVFGQNSLMPRTFAYLRVSTPGQTTDNQLTEIQAAGITIEPRRLVTETVSGSTAVGQRRGFARLLDRLEAGDVLVVTKLDRSAATPWTWARPWPGSRSSA